MEERVGKHVAESDLLGEATTWMGQDLCGDVFQGSGRRFVGKIERSYVHDPTQDVGQAVDGDGLAEARVVLQTVGQTLKRARVCSSSVACTKEGRIEADYSNGDGEGAVGVDGIDGVVEAVDVGVLGEREERGAGGGVLGEKGGGAGVVVACAHIDPIGVVGMAGKARGVGGEVL